MTTDYVIGIDGGATRSEAVAMAEDGQILAKASGDALNEYAESAVQFRDHLRTLLDRLTCELTGNALAAVIGTASLFDEAAADVKHRLLSEIDSLPELTTLCGDAVAALHGATQGEPGILVIAGTGSIAMAVDSNGERHTVGGLGALLGGDPGSAYWMSCQAILAAQANTSPDQALTRLIYDFFKIDSLTDLVERTASEAQPVRSVAALSGHLAQGDPQNSLWSAIEQSAGNELAKLVWPLLKKDVSLPLFHSGSVLARNERVRKAFTAALAKRSGHDVVSQSPQASSVDGAAHMAWALHRRHSS